MNAINGKKILRSLKRRLLDYKDEGSRIMAIHTGLSVTIMGFVVSLDRNEDLRVAKVVVEGVPTEPVAMAAVKVAASLLAQRARRFLGNQWQVIEWAAPREAGSRGA